MACSNKISQARWLKQHDFISHSSGRRNQQGVGRFSFSWGTLFLAYRIRALRPRLTLITPLEAPFPNTATLGMRASTDEFYGGHTNMQSVTEGSQLPLDMGTLRSHMKSSYYPTQHEINSCLLILKNRWRAKPRKV